jgi:hypothetical protein
MGAITQIIKVLRYQNGTQGLRIYYGKIERKVFPMTITDYTYGVCCTEITKHEKLCCKVNGKLHVVEMEESNYRVDLPSMDKLPRDITEDN